MSDDDFKDISESFSNDDEGGLGFGMSEDLKSLFKSVTYEDIEAMTDDEFVKYFTSNDGEAPSLRIDIMNDPRADVLFERMDRLGLSI